MIDSGQVMPIEGLIVEEWGAIHELPKWIMARDVRVLTG